MLSLTALCLKVHKYKHILIKLLTIVIKLDMLLINRHKIINKYIYRNYNKLKNDVKFGQNDETDQDGNVVFLPNWFGSFIVML